MRRPERNPLLEWVWVLVFLSGILLPVFLDLPRWCDGVLYLTAILVAVFKVRGQR